MLGQVLACVGKSKLFQIPVDYDAFLGSPNVAADGETDQQAALREFLKAPFTQIERYLEYVGGQSSFATHQGVKGLEFPRVMTIMDDDESGATFFSYDKLFGIADRSTRDIENEQAGKETTIDRTRRLLYVTCSRAQQSLALVAYASSPDKLQANLISYGWFAPNEIHIL